jgi:hypothetical protein
VTDDSEQAVPHITVSTLIWAATVMFIAIVAAAVVLTVAVPDAQNPPALIGQLLASFAVLTASLVGLYKIGKVERKVQDAAENTATIVEQTNSNLDARIKMIGYDSMRRALEDHLNDHDDGQDHGLTRS